MAPALTAAVAKASRLHIVFALLLIKLALFLGSGILVLLVLGDQIVHIGFGLSEFHLVHALPGVPMKESLAPEHGGEVLSHSLEHFLDRGRITSKSHRHLETLRWNIADGCLDVVRDPL